MALSLIPKSERIRGGRVRSREIEEARDRLIESAGKISANMLGMVSRVGGQIYALLFLSRDPVSLDQITQDLKISKGNASVHIRLLEETGLVKKVWVKGDRKNYYSVSLDYPKKLLKGFFDRVRDGIENSLRVIHTTQGQFDGIEGRVKGADLEDTQFIIAQLGRLQSFYQAASQLFENFYQGKPVNINLLRQVILE